MVELSSIIQTHSKILRIDLFLPSVFQNLKHFESALGYGLFYELEIYHYLAEEIVFKLVNFFHENIDISLMNNTFIIGHQKLNLRAVTMIKNNSENYFMSIVH